jgi:hypothetical protein
VLASEKSFAGTLYAKTFSGLPPLRLVEIRALFVTNNYLALASQKAEASRIVGHSRRQREPITVLPPVTRIESEFDVPLPRTLRGI